MGSPTTSAEEVFTGDEYSQAHYLTRNNTDYESMLTVIGSPGTWDAETLAILVGQVAGFAFDHHPGRFVDGALENVLLEIGGELGRDRGGPAANWKRLVPPCARRPGRRHVLHVATGIQAVGGHTRTIRNWIDGDPESCHYLLLTWQGKDRVPEWVADSVRRNGGDLIVLPDESPVSAAQWRSGLSPSPSPTSWCCTRTGSIPFRSWPSRCRTAPRSALVNFNDHLFWMGNTIADTVVNQRRLGKVHGAERRLPEGKHVAADSPHGGFRFAGQDRRRRRLGIPDDQTVLLTVGRASKFLPTPTHNLVRTARTILGRVPAAHLYLLGVAEHDLSGCPDVESHPRLHFLGPIEDPSDYRAAADVYLEGFPVGSQTALLEAALAALPLVRAFSPPLNLLATDDEVFDGLAAVPADEEEYIDTVVSLVRDPSGARELGEALRERVRRCHLCPEWRHRLYDFYAFAGGLTHTPGPIPATRCVATPRDIALSAFQAKHARKTSPGRQRPDAVGAFSVDQRLHRPGGGKLQRRVPVAPRMHPPAGLEHTGGEGVRKTTRSPAPPVDPRAACAACAACSHPTTDDLRAARPVGAETFLHKTKLPPIRIGGTRSDPVIHTHDSGTCQRCRADLQQRPLGRRRPGQRPGPDRAARRP